MGSKKRAGKLRPANTNKKNSSSSAKKDFSKLQAVYSQQARVLMKGHIFTDLTPINNAVGNFSGGRILHLASGSSKQFKEDSPLGLVLTMAKLKWFIHISVTYIDQRGKKAIEAVSVRCKHPRTRVQILDILNESHYEIISDVGSERVINIVWMACPSGIEITDEYAYGLLDLMGAWDQVEENGTVPECA